MDTIDLSHLETLPSYGWLGNRSYELTNHLGNVLTSISDIVYPISSGGTAIDYYQVGINQVTDYSPFGVQLDGRTITGGIADKAYRYGFQNQEKDNEIKGEGNSLNYEFRMHDPRLGRFFAIDPLEAKYPQWTPYQFSGNQVISTAELEGLEPEIDVNEAKEGVQYQAADKGSKASLKDRIIYNWKINVSASGSRAWVADGTIYTGPTKEEYANMSSDAYEANVKTNKIGSAAPFTDYKLFMKYNLGEKNLGFKAATYVRTIDGVNFWVLAYAGSDDLEDALDDFRAGTGRPSGQITLAIVTAQAVHNAIKDFGPGNNLTFTGHSLGGGLAAAAAYVTNLKATTFNAMGITPTTALFHGLNTENEMKLINAYIIQNEIVNAGQYSKADGVHHIVKTLPGKKYNMIQRHLIDRFTEIWNK